MPYARRVTADPSASIFEWKLSDQQLSVMWKHMARVSIGHDWPLRFLDDRKSEPPDSDGDWDELTIWLGSFASKNVISRARQIKTYGWGLVAVIVRSGKWTFRRPATETRAPSPPVNTNR
jgi:hypothetical protein